MRQKLTTCKIYSARSAAQNVTQSVLSHPLAKPILKNIPDPIVQFANAPAEISRLQESAGVGVSPIYNAGNLGEEPMSDLTEFSLMMLREYI